MSESLKTLNELFVNFGVPVEAGDQIDWHNYQIKTEFDASVIDLVRDQVAQINKGSGLATSGPTMFCNPVIHIFQKLEFVARYFYGEFEIQTKDKIFRETIAGIWYQFIKGWYFGVIYIGYGEDFELLDRLKFEEEGKNFYLEGTPGKFRLFSRSSEDTFHSILSGQAGLVFSKEQQRRLVKVDCGGYYNWLYWWHLWLKWLRGMQRFEISINALSKNVIMTPKSDDEYKQIVEQLENNETFIKRGGNQDFGGESVDATAKTKFDEIEFMPRENPMAILEGIQRAFELNAAHMGYAGRMEVQKKERVNAGENFPHQKVVSNIRTYFISTLNYVFDQMRIKFKDKEGNRVVPDDLKIVPTNQTFAQGIPEFQQGGSFNQGFQQQNPKYFDWQQKQNQKMDNLRGND